MFVLFFFGGGDEQKHKVFLKKKALIETNSGNLSIPPTLGPGQSPSPTPGQSDDPGFETSLCEELSWICPKSWRLQIV